MEAPPLPSWKQKLLEKRGERTGRGGVTATRSRGGSSDGHGSHFLLRPTSSPAERSVPAVRTVHAVPERRACGSGFAPADLSQSRGASDSGSAGAESGGCGGGGGGGGSWRRGQERGGVVVNDASGGVKRGGTAGSLVTGRATTQYRADSSDTWRNRELKMGVSVTSGAMASNSRRGGYGRPFRLARGPAIPADKQRTDQRPADDTNSDSSSEELRYGPGIVSRLKNRYITMALRESAGRRPPLRRVTSLEDMLDKEGAFACGNVRDSYILEGRAGRTRVDSMKRAKSVGDLASARAPEGAAPDGSGGTGLRGRKEVPPIATEKVVLVEQTRQHPAAAVAAVASATVSQSSENKPGDSAATSEVISKPATMPNPAPTTPTETLPPPDTVRTVKRLFEPSPRRSVSSRATPGDTRGFGGQRSDRPTSRSTYSDSGRRLSPVVRHLTVTPRSSAIKSTQPVAKHASRPSPPAVSNAARSTAAKPFGTGPTAANFSSLPSGPTLLAGTRRSLTSSSLSSETQSRAEKPWTHQRRQDTTDHAGGEAVLPASLPSSPSRVAKKPLSREPSSEPASPTASSVRRQVGIIKPTRKVEHKDEFNRRKNTLNHVRNSVVEKEIAVIGTEYLKRKEEEKEITNKPASLSGPTEAVTPVLTSPEVKDPPAPALPPRKALVVEPKKPLTIETAPPPRPAPFRGIILKPVPKADFARSGSREGRPLSPPPPPPPSATNGARTPTLGSHASIPEPAKPAAAVPPAVTRPQPSAVPAAVKPAPEPEALPPSWAPSSAAPGTAKQKWHQAPDTSMVFNFTKRQDVPDYVEDDGLILRRKLPKSGDSGYVILPGFDPGQSCDDDVSYSLVSGPPSPCNVVFLNADIVINGKSSLMKKPKPRKMTVSFDVSGPSTHEYPSEASQQSSEPAAHPTVASAPDGRLGALANYTPSKVATGVDFELGVSRLAVPAPPPREDQRLSPDEFLKPAAESETVVWSSDTSADMLF